jgi:pimeloyl-ACP methyl ester carboxylesterase
MNRIFHAPIAANLSLLAMLATTLLLATGCAADRTVRTGFIQTDAGPLYYEECGHGRPVVLIHGGQMDCRMWDDQFAALPTDRFRWIRYDVRGFGQSPPATQPYSYHDDLHALLAGLQIDKATIVGLSLGGRIALDFALAYPDQVDKLVPVAPGLSGFRWSEPMLMRLQQRSSVAQTGDDARVADLWLADPMMAGVNANPQLRARVRAWLIDNGPAWRIKPGQFRPLQPPAVGRLAEIHAPLLVIVGDRDEENIQKIVTQIAEQVPGAQRVVIPGAGHIVNLERPQEFNAALLRFLSE